MRLPSFTRPGKASTYQNSGEGKPLSFEPKVRLIKLKHFFFSSFEGFLLLTLFFFVINIFVSSFPSWQKPALPQIVKKEIGFRGGKLKSPDRKLILEIPVQEKGVVAKTATGGEVKTYELKQVSLDPVALPEKLAFFNVSAVAKEVSPESEKGQPVTEFSQPLILTYSYDDKGLGGLTESSLHFVRFNEEAVKWEPIETRVDTENNLLTAQISHLSTFAVSGDPAVVVPETLKNFEVSLFTGNAAFSYPIKVPAGVGGLTPGLNLTYNTNSVNYSRSEFSPGSWVGMGWNFDIGHISTSETEPFVWKNWLVLNGVSHELVQSSGFSGPEDILGKYQTKIQSFLKITKFGSDPGKPHREDWYWQVVDKQGIVYEFGKTVWLNNYHSCEYNYVSWPLEKIIDTHGNTITIEYDITQLRWTHPDCTGPTYTRELYPKRIFYTTNERTGDTLAEYQIEFVLESKVNMPSAPGATANYETKRVKEIRVLVWDPVSQTYQKQRSYHFSYLNNPTQPTANEREKYYNLLTQMAEKGVGEEALPAMTFDYGEPFELYYKDWVERPGGGGSCKKIESFDRYYLRKAQNGYGGEVSFEYESFIFPWMDICPLGKGWNQQRVLKKTDNSGQASFGPTIFTSYTYGGAIGGGSWGYSDLKGFAYVTVTTPTSQNRSHFYGKDVEFDSLNGKLLFAESKDGQGKLFAKTENTYARKTYSYDAGDSEFPYLTETKSTVWDGNDSFKETRSTFEYDNYGNQKMVSEEGDLAVSGDERTTLIEYNYNTTKRILSKAKSQKVFKGLTTTDSAIIRQTSYNYDGATDSSIPPSIGDLTRSNVYYQFPAGAFYSTKTNYDLYGQPIETEDALGRKASTEYDTTFPTFSTKATNAKGQSELAEYDFLKGVTIRTIDANGIATGYRYDNFGRLIKVIREGVDTELSPSTEYTYFEGNPSWVLARTKNDPGFVEAKTFYDGLGRTLQTQTQGPGGKIVLSNTHYNEMGQADKTTLPYFVSQEIGDLLPPDWSKPSTLTVYDAMGRVASITDAQGQTTRTFYDDFTTTVVDAKNHQKTTEKDAQGNLVKVIEYQGEYPSASEYATTTYEYDLLGNLTKVNAPKGITTTISYDNLGRKTQMDDPDLGTWKYEYDPVGNLTKQTDAKNQEIRLEYDELNRLTRKIYPDNSSVDFEYDLGANAIGKRTKITDNSGQTSYTYDERGRVSREEVVIDNQTFGFDFTYDAVDRLKTLIYPDDEVVTYTYNDLGQLVSAQGDDVYLAEATYDQPSGKMTAQVLGNTAKTIFDYDVLQRLTSLSTQSTTGSLQSLGYVYDPVGNITQISDALTTSETTNFNYDFLNRLTSASGPYQASYAYDEVGNILTKNEDTLQLALEYADPAHRHAPSKVSGQDYAYDANGNLVTDGKRTYTYNYDNRPVEIDYQGVKSLLTYNGDGRRVKKAISGGTTPSFPKGWNLVTAAIFGEANEAKTALESVQNSCQPETTALTRNVLNWTQVYLPGYGGMNFTLSEGENYQLYLSHACVSPENMTILYPSESYQVVLENGEVTKHYMAGGKAVAIRKGEELYFMHTDHLGSTTFVTDPTGEKSASQKYYPYGLTRETE